MKIKSSVLLAIGALSLGLLFYFPMWKIQLDAPQYPEGLEMHIWINKLGGGTEFTIQNFNILNHYIGMAEIHEDAFPELKIMPWVVKIFMVLGVLFALIRNKYLLLTWVVLLSIAGMVGLGSFYNWLQEFGTNLDPMAPIKVPGATYIPPLLGSKYLLNFKALSLPYWGSLGIALALGLGFLAIYIEFIKSKFKKRSQ